MNIDKETIIVTAVIFFFSVFLVSFPAFGIFILGLLFLASILAITALRVKNMFTSPEALEKKQRNYELSELKKLGPIKQELESITGEVFMLKKMLGHFVYHNSRLNISIIPKKTNFIDLSKHEKYEKDMLPKNFYHSKVVFGKTVVPRHLFESIFNNLKSMFSVYVNKNAEDHFVFELDEAFITLPYLELHDMAEDSN